MEAIILKKYYNNELIKLKAFFDNELEFYKYYRSSSTYLDYKYFMRGVFDIKMSLDSYYFETDRSFSTSHDFKVAKILANDLIQLYLEHQLIMIVNKDISEKSQRKPNIKISWTSSKVALIQLMYALHSEGVFNNGAADLKEIAEYFEHTFEIDLGQYAVNRQSINFILAFPLIYCQKCQEKRLNKKFKFGSLLNILLIVSTPES